MKILYIITQADGGGAQKYTLALAKHFNGSIAAGTEASQLFNDAEAVGVMTIKFKHLKRNIHPWHDLLAIFEIARVIKKTHPDIVHLNSTKAGLLGSIAGKLTGAKVVFTAHGFRFLEPLSPATQWFYLILEKIASHFRDFIITASDKDRLAAVNHNVISPDKITTIYNGLPSINFLSKDEARRQLGLVADKKIIGTIANDYATKGLDILEQAAEKIQTSVVVIGATANSNSAGKLLRLGYKPNASQYLKAFDIFVMPSRKEGFPFGLIEAMQAGLPIVATRVGGIPEALGNTGLLVEPENPEQLAQALEKLLTNTHLAGELGQKAREQSTKFSEQQMLNNTKEIYDLVLKP